MSKSPIAFENSVIEICENPIKDPGVGKILVIIREPIMVPVNRRDGSGVEYAVAFDMSKEQALSLLGAFTTALTAIYGDLE
jgi:hypothetical protein